MLIIGFNLSTGHEGLKSHYERPGRFTNAIEELSANYPEKILQSSEINREEIFEMMRKVHTKEYIESITNVTMDQVYCRLCTKKIPGTSTACCNCNNPMCEENIIGYLSPDTYWTPRTLSVVIEGIHVLKGMVDKIATKDAKYGYALVRPPGHHCDNQSQGFCVVNNVAITAKYAQQYFNRVAILDIDFHHGNGTENLVKQLENIYFISLHGYGEFIYPGTGGTSSDRILNIPIDITIDPESREYVTDTFYLQLITSQVLPFLRQIQPNFLIISNGLDGHRNDPLEGLNVTDMMYVELCKLLKTLGIPLLYVTEGGYSPDVISNVTRKVVAELLV
jgi:acetoin utilization deacetylase AcuC-like enzyme